jgi:hypothetical protein
VPAWISVVKPYADLLLTIATVGALTVGAIWSRRTIFKKREEFPKIGLTHSIYASTINSQHRFLRVTLTIENQGQVLVRLDEVDTWLYQLNPWPEDILDEQKMLEPGQGHYRWPGVQGVTNRIVETKKVEIEPGEMQDFSFDFVFEVGVRVVIVYSYVNNPTKREGIGWNLSTIHEAAAG